ncbi:MAG: peptidylprolyl isomerase [Pseudomonadota bacterium]|nr:peptidylprolyl isomerase [Pseudomonadota bacterium]
MQGFRDLVHGWFGKAVVVVVVALFALYGTDALVSLASKPQPVARVHDAELYRDQLSNMVMQQKQTILRQNPGLPLDLLKDDFLRSSVAQRWVERQLIDQALLEWGFRPDQKTVVAQLKADSRFATDGQINQQLLEAWLTQNNLTPEVLFNEIRTNLSLDQLLTGLEDSEFVVPKEVNQILSLQEQKRSFEMATISPESVIDEVDLSDKKLQAYYEEHQSQYMNPETAKVQYIVFDEAQMTADLEINPSDAELQGYYENYKQNLLLDEQRQASHILIDTSARSEDEAKELADSIYERIQNGEAFADLAKEFSDDKPSAVDGGSLPMAERGTFVEEFENALYSLNEGEVSQPVKTDFGYHIIKLDGKESPEAVSFEDKKPELVEEFAKRQKDEAFRTKLDDIELVAFESSNLEQLAEQYELEVQTTDAFNQSNAPAPLNSKDVLDTVFGSTFFDEGRNSDLIELDGKVVIVHPVEYTPAAPKSFASVKEDVKKAATEEAAVELAAEKGRAIMAQLKLGKALSEEQTALLGEWAEHKETERRTTDVSAGVIQKLFAMAKPSEDKPEYASVQQQGNFVILKLDSVVSAATAEDGTLESVDEDTVATLGEQLKMSNAQSLTALLVDALKDGADIEYNIGLGQDSL